MSTLDILIAVALMLPTIVAVTFLALVVYETVSRTQQKAELNAAYEEYSNSDLPVRPDEDTVYLFDD